MTPLTEQIKTCRTPQEALLLLAAAIDELREQPAAADPWEQPLQWQQIDLSDHGLKPDVEVKVNADLSTNIAQVEAELAEAGDGDGDERRALEAKLRLLKDKGKSLPASYVPEGQRLNIEEGTVDVPPVSAERGQARRNWASDVQLWDYIPLDMQATLDSFAKGGPLWLYYSNRDAVMQLPLDARAWLVADVELDSPAQAHEVARDILKSAESADRSITIEAIDALSNSRG